MKRLIPLDTVKSDLIKFEEMFHQKDLGHRIDYLILYEHDLITYYQTRDFPDNLEVRYSADVSFVSNNTYRFCFNFHLGDFNLGSGNQHCHPYKRLIDKAAANYLYNRLVAVGLWNTSEPIKVGAVADKLFPAEKRKRISDYFNNDKQDKNAEWFKIKV